LSSEFLIRLLTYVFFLVRMKSWPVAYIGVPRIWNPTSTSTPDISNILFFSQGLLFLLTFTNAYHSATPSIFTIFCLSNDGRGWMTQWHCVTLSHFNAPIFLTPFLFSGQNIQNITYPLRILSCLYSFDICVKTETARKRKSFKKYYCVFPVVVFVLFLKIIPSSRQSNLASCSIHSIGRAFLETKLLSFKNYLLSILKLYMLSILFLNSERNIGPFLFFVLLCFGVPKRFSPSWPPRWWKRSFLLPFVFTWMLVFFSEWQIYFAWQRREFFFYIFLQGP